MVIKDESERRSGIRVEFETDVTVSVEGMETRHKGSSKDLGMRGVFVRTAKHPEVNTVCLVTIRLQGLDDEVILKMDGHVVRTTDEGYAIYFDSVDLDTYTHLKNIVRYNTPDSDVL